MENLFNFIDDFGIEMGDCEKVSRIIISNIDVEKMEEIEYIADYYVTDHYDKDDILEEHRALFNKYYDEWNGAEISKLEIIENIVKAEGFTWIVPEIKEIRWQVKRYGLY